MTAEEHKEIGDIKHDISSIRQQFVNFQATEKNERVNLENKIDRLLILLEGDHIDPKRGLFYRVQVIEDFVKSIEKMKSYWSGNLAAGVFFIALGSSIIAIIYKIITFFASIGKP